MTELEKVAIELYELHYDSVFGKYCKQDIKPTMWMKIAKWHMKKVLEARIDEHNRSCYGCEICSGCTREEKLKKQLKALEEE